MTKMVTYLNLPHNYAMMPNHQTSTGEVILSKITQDFSELLQMYRAAPLNKLEANFQNKCSIKDTFAVASAWIWRFAALLDEAHLSNGPLLADPDVDGLNREYAANRANWTRLEVELDFYKSHLALLKVLKRFPPERLADDTVRQLIDTEVYQRHHNCLEAFNRSRYAPRCYKG